MQIEAHWKLHRPESYAELERTGWLGPAAENTTNASLKALEAAARPPPRGKQAVL